MQEALLARLQAEHPWIKVGAWARHIPGVLNSGYPMQVISIEPQHNTLIVVLTGGPGTLRHQIDGFLWTFEEVKRSDPCIGKGLEPFWSHILSGV